MMMKKKKKKSLFSERNKGINCLYKLSLNKASSSFSVCLNDHSIVTSNVNISLNSNRKPIKDTPIDRAQNTLSVDVISICYHLILTETKIWKYCSIHKSTHFHHIFVSNQFQKKPNTFRFSTWNRLSIDVSCLDIFHSFKNQVISLNSIKMDDFLQLENVRFEWQHVLWPWECVRFPSICIIQSLVLNIVTTCQICLIFAGTCQNVTPFNSTFISTIFNLKSTKIHKFMSISQFFDATEWESWKKNRTLTPLTGRWLNGTISVVEPNP